MEPEAKLLFVLLDHSNNDCVTHDAFQGFWLHTSANITHHQPDEDELEGAQSERSLVSAESSDKPKERNVPWLLAQMEALQNLKAGAR